MKRIFIVLLPVIFTWQEAVSQCTLANPGVKFNYAVIDGSNCRINIDLYFDLIHNPGGKFVWVHIWPTGSYANWNYSGPPTSGNGGLTGSIATFGIEHQQSSLVIQGTYPPDPLAPGVQSAGLTASEGPGILSGSERYTIRNVTLLIPGGCNIPQSFTADVWQSQSAQAQVVHCFNKGMVFYANDPTATGFINCVIPRTYSFIINTIGTTPMDVTYKVYIDDGDGIFNPNLDNIEVLNGTASLNAAGNFHFLSGIQTYAPYSGQKPYTDRDLWLQLTTPSVPNAQYSHILNSCTPLPVALSDFRASRKNEQVLLSWATSSELNNRGFQIQRQLSENWETIAYISSKADNGNSDIELNYAYTDLNRNSGLSKYRLLQVDMDGKTRISETRLVAGLDMKGSMLVFPNPSPDGRITIVTDGWEGEFVARLFDMNGRLLQQEVSRGGKEISMQVNHSGTYLLQLQDRSSGRMLSRKVLIGF